MGKSRSDNETPSLSGFRTVKTRKSLWPIRGLCRTGSIYTLQVWSYGMELRIEQNYTSRQIGALTDLDKQFLRRLSSSLLRLSNAKSTDASQLTSRCRD